MGRSASEGSECRHSCSWRRTGLAWSVLAAALCHACAWVQIRSDDGQVHVERYFGVVSLQLSPATRSHVVHLKGVGLISTGFEATVGYVDLTMAALGNDCRLVVWLDDKDQIDELRRVAQELRDACVVDDHDIGETRL